MTTSRSFVIPGFVAAFLVVAAGLACRRSSSGAPTSPIEASAPAVAYKLPELDGPEPILIPPNYGRYLARTVSKPDVTPKEEKAGVTLKVCVDRDGGLTSSEVVRSYKPEIDRAVVEAAKAWRFKPYMVKDAPKAFCFVQVFAYRRGADPAWTF